MREGGATGSDSPVPSAFENETGTGFCLHGQFLNYIVIDYYGDYI